MVAHDERQSLSARAQQQVLHVALVAVDGTLADAGDVEARLLEGQADALYGRIAHGLVADHAALAHVLASGTVVTDVNETSQTARST